MFEGELQTYEENLHKQLEALPDGPMPMSIPCPHCGAGAGRACVSRNSSYGAKTHQKRWAAIGIKHPTLNDLERDWLDFQIKRLESRIAATPTLEQVLGKPRL